ncbi:response regulator transcription factor [Cellulophaga baltica]|uniref:response regulator transcription factor n=1 Tax=Cellulophaga TaxID=104264 RepID=UPI001C065E77|nr:response regulator transcription factor [Cellulophaga sp. 1_MG-2023]MBU2994853.1 response regulator transcription factor [Cellulophaga baltica]MDO6766248.1 response regulator transcription factor [Cellulophaga sp. 1_MG-2023]
MKILIIEDEQQLLYHIKESLEKEKFLVETASDYHSAYEKIFIYEYDCILLDIMLPNGSGLELLNELKKAKKSENIIIISAKDSLDDKLKGLELGADDYLTKPFHLAELNARIKAVIRRKELNGKNTIEFGNTTLVFKERQFFVDNKLVTLNRKEFDILNYFMSNKNRLITKNALAEHVWGDNTDQADNFDFVYYQIKNLRKKLVKSKVTFEIESIYGVGYKLILI